MGWMAGTGQDPPEPTPFLVTIAAVGAGDTSEASARVPCYTA